MCGIAGILNPPGAPVNPALLRRMIDRIRYRGPDFRGAWTEGRAGFAHARLSIIDIGGGRQPMHSDDRSLTLTFNGEIFNYIELRNELRAKGVRFTTDSDTEVILRLYEERGAACVEALNGDFAFAIWDARKQTLFAARDRMGVRPFYYTQVGGAQAGSFLFASEVKALFAHPRVRRNLDLEGLDQIFTFWSSLPPKTVFQNINELPPAHTLTVKDGKVEMRRYWQLDYTVEPSSLSEDERAEELLALLVDATKIRLRADVPVGAYLSGGLDSSLVSAIARKYTAADLNTFSVTFEDPEFDESGFQREMAQLLGTAHREVRCGRDEIAKAFPEVILHAERPVLRTAPAPLYLLSRLVRENGFKVVLTGEGADEVFGGYDIFKEAKLRRFCARYPDSKMRPLLLKRLYPYLPALQLQSPAFLQAFFRNRNSGIFDSHMPRWELTAGLKRFYSDDTRAALGGHNPYATLQAGLPEAYGRWDAFSQSQYLEASMLLPGYILSAQGDRVAMAHAVEGRFPFLDHRVVELAGRLPARLKMKALKEKYLLKRAAKDLLPDSVRNRPKQPYRAPDAASFFSGRSGQAGPALDYVGELLSSEALERAGLFHAPAVQLLAEKARTGRAAGTKDNMALVGILSCQLLHRQFIEPAPLEKNPGREAVLTEEPA